MVHMRMKLWIVVICFGSIVNLAFSQPYKTGTEIGFYGGGAYYLGDLNQYEHFTNSSAAFGLVYRYNLSIRH